MPRNVAQSSDAEEVAFPHGSCKERPLLIDAECAMDAVVMLDDVIAHARSVRVAIVRGLAAYNRPKSSQKKAA